MNAEAERGLQIRLATPADVEEIASVLLKSFVEFQSLYTADAFAATVLTPEQIQGRMNEGPVWVAIDSGELVGAVSAIVTEDGLYVRGMAVNPAARGKRIGHELLNCIERFAVDNKCNRIFLSTTPFLSRAIKLYERFGFRKNAEGPDNLFGTPLFTMVKSLSALRLRRTKESDLDYVLAAEHSEENRLFVIPWSREEHLQALANPDIAHLIVEAETSVAYVILAGLRDPNR